MSLQVWLPLNGNLNNQGIENVTVTNKGVTVDDNGKIGKCYSTKDSYITIDKTAARNLTGDFSVACWVYINSWNTSYQTVWSTSISGQAWNQLPAVLLRNNTNNSLCFSICDNSGYVGTSCSTGTLSTGKWYHFVCCYKAGSIMIYQDGALVKEFKTTIVPRMSDVTDFQIGRCGSVYLCDMKINDFRVYDQCLSPREIKEISKGIVLHYPLNDISSTLGANKYSGDSFEGKPNNLGTYTYTKLSGERGYNYKLNYTGTGSDMWLYIRFSAVPFTVGKTYDWSCKVRVHSCSAGSLLMRTSRIDNDWSAPVMKTVVSSSLADGKWHEYHGRTTLAEKSTRSGTEYTTSPRMEFYTESLKTSGTVFSMDFDLKDVQICECESDAPTNDGNWVDNVVYDVSGYSNNGTVATSTKPGWIGDSPRYGGCYTFADKHYITGECPWGTANVTQLTINLWINQTSGGSYSTFLTSNGYGNSGLWLAINTEREGQWGYRGSVSPNYIKSGNLITTNTWHMFTYVFDGGVATWYLDGVKGESVTYADTSIPLASTIVIGDSYTGTQWDTTFKGKMSDVRIYATALSAEDIKELYNTPFSVANNGVMMLQGEVVED